MSFSSGSQYNDVLVYGYAYKNHWMWFNGYAHDSLSNIYSFVVWKDYNCQTWKNLGTNPPSANRLTGFSPIQQKMMMSFVNGISSSEVLNDPWTLAKKLVDRVQASSDFVVSNDRAYSIIFQQLGYLYTSLEARVCVVGQ